MIKLEEAQVGDCVYAKLTIQQAPVFGEITRVLETENAIEIRTDLWGTRIVIVENAYWEEKLAKKGKIVKIQNNYTEWAKEMLQDEKTETDNRIDTIHNRQPEKCETERSAKRTKSVSNSTKRKQKIVRKSSTKRRKTQRNRKTSRSKK